MLSLVQSYSSIDESDMKVDSMSVRLHLELQRMLRIKDVFAVSSRVTHAESSDMWQV